MQAKDIPDEAFLAAVRVVNEVERRWALYGDLMSTFPGIPYKVLRAKADRLIRRGLLDGCACGCRGDFRLP